MSKVEERVIDLVSKILRLKADQINHQSAMGSTEHWNSLAQITILSGLEQEFGLEIDPECAVDLISVDRICQFLVAKGKI